MCGVEGLYRYDTIIEPESVVALPCTASFTMSGAGQLALVPALTVDCMFRNDGSVELLPVCNNSKVKSGGGVPLITSVYTIALTGNDKLGTTQIMLSTSLCQPSTCA